MKLIVLAALFGVGYQIFATLLGSKIASIILPKQTNENDELKTLISLALGVLTHASCVAVAIFFAPWAINYLLWILLALVIFDWRRTSKFIAKSRDEILMASVYGLLCFALIIGFHFGATRGDTLFWSIYKLTNVTPGDSPQGLMQAQYLLYGQSLSELRNFSMFDRPFLGGIISLAALSSVKLEPGQIFNSFTENQIFAYSALWIWLNAGLTYATAAMSRRFISGSHGQVFFCAVLLAAPFIVFNTIGVWPKLFAVYIVCCAAILAIGGYWKFAILLSGASFLVHGSFLWSHLAMCGILILYVLTTQTSYAKKIRHAAFLVTLAVAFPVFWFVAERFSGESIPLRAYYLYNATINQGLYQSPYDIAKAFYTSTSPENLAVLPFMNFIKCLIPNNLLLWITSFSFTSKAVSWRDFGDILTATQVTSPFFSFGITAGLIALISIMKFVSKNWCLTLAISAFFLLPLIPGMMLYRRDDIFVGIIMMFTFIPMVIALALGFGQFNRNKLAVVTSIIFIEYAFVYWSRYPGIRYEDGFYEYYLWIVLPLIAVTYAVAMADALLWKRDFDNTRFILKERSFL